MLYIDPNFFLEAIQKKDFIRFEKPIIYNHHLKQHLLNLSDAILTEKNSLLCNELFLQLSDSLVEQDFSASLKKDSFVMNKAKEIIHSYADNILKLEDICEELQLTTFQFIRFFKKHTGITPYQYFLNCKVERAKSIIEHTADIYAAVAQCGYVDLTHLNKQFKRTFGITAFEYQSLVHNK
jgi:AraC-like DNA-binding protein